MKLSFYKVNLSILLVSALSLASITGCESKPDTSPKDPLAIAYERGRTIYQTQCTACHNSDPRKAGSIGPELFGSSRELIEARVVRAEYPTGYKPKRETHQMAPLPHLKGEIDALTAYLNK